MCADPRVPEAVGSVLGIRPGHPASEQRGQALVEAVLAIALLGLATASLAWLGRLMSLQMATVNAASSLAFECAAFPVACSGEEVPRRFKVQTLERHFGLTQADGSGSSSATASQGALSQHYWRDAAGQAMLMDPARVSLDFLHPSFDAGANIMRSALPIGNLGTVSGRANPERFGLSSRSGLVAASVSTSLDGRVPGLRSAPSESLSLRFGSTTAVLTDSWPASSYSGAAPDSVAARVDEGRRLDGYQEQAISAGYALTIRGLALFGAVGLEPLAPLFDRNRIDYAIPPSDRVLR